MIIAAAEYYPVVNANAKEIKMAKTININDFVLISMNRAVLSTLTVKEHDSFAQKDGRLKMQLWQVMQTFGSQLYLGCFPPFETTIELCEDVKEVNLEDGMWEEVG